jgi:copper chaperone CopZ
MKSLILTMALAIITNVSYSQIKNAKTVNVKINGNCGMCKTKIEKTGSQANVSKTIWNMNNRLAKITFDSKKTNLAAILKNIALAGYDNQEYTAPTASYDGLHDCCKYDREKANTPVAATDSSHSGHHK